MTSCVPLSASIGSAGAPLDDEASVGSAALEYDAPRFFVDSFEVVVERPLEHLNVLRRRFCFGSSCFFIKLAVVLIMCHPINGERIDALHLRNRTILQEPGGRPDSETRRMMRLSNKNIYVCIQIFIYMHSNISHITNEHTTNTYVNYTTRTATKHYETYAGASKITRNHIRRTRVKIKLIEYATNRNVNEIGTFGTYTHTF